MFIDAANNFCFFLIPLHKLANTRTTTMGVYTYFTRILLAFYIIHYTYFTRILLILLVFYSPFTLHIIRILLVFYSYFMHFTHTLYIIRILLVFYSYIIHYTYFTRILLVFYVFYSYIIHYAYFTRILRITLYIIRIGIDRTLGLPRSTRRPRFFRLLIVHMSTSDVTV